MALSSARQVFCRALTKLHNNHSCVSRTIRTSAGLNAKRIVVQKEQDNVTVIRGEFVESPHAGNVISSGAEGCPLCALRIYNVTHDDVLIVSQFMDKEGEMLPRTVTGLCEEQHRRVASALYRAQRVGLIYSEKHAPRERWQELNNYFGTTRTKTDFGKAKIDIKEFLKRPREDHVWTEKYKGK